MSHSCLPLLKIRRQHRTKWNDIFDMNKTLPRLLKNQCSYSIKCVNKIYTIFHRRMHCTYLCLHLNRFRWCSLVLQLTIPDPRIFQLHGLRQVVYIVAAITRKVANEYCSRSTAVNKPCAGQIEREKQHTQHTIQNAKETMKDGHVRDDDNNFWMTLARGYCWPIKSRNANCQANDK